MTLDGKVVLITGAKGGLGSFVTRAVLDAGARVAGASRSIADSDFPDARFVAFPSALSSREACTDLVNRVVSQFGRIDALVHLVGGFAGGKRVDETATEDLDAMLDVNFRSAFHLIGAVLPVMRRQGSGRILAVGSRSALEPSPKAAAYAASKAALVSLLRSVAAENRKHNVQANTVLPGTMDTPANRVAMPETNFASWVDPKQVANLLVFLASDAATHVNGAAIPVLAGEA